MDSSTVETWSDAGIDRKALRQTVERFRRINDARLERYRESRNERQRQLLDLLPLLFHLDHPLLPGAGSGPTPFGVAGYQPGREALHAAQQLSRAFRYNPVSEQQRDIDALYLMGSVGSFACNASSDLDIWLCHRPGLDGAAVDRLRRKTQRIARWAAELDLDLHFFVFDCDSFRRGEQSELSSESSGSAQHGLLLDEFYRTGLLLAGRYPIWWLTPPELEAHHAEHAEWLRQRRFIDAREVIDFGSVARVPSEEFLGAGIWQLFKSIDAPYKSVLKLLLIECYASQQPASRALALDYKTAIYAGITDPDQLDPYVFLYRRLEAHLQEQHDPQRIELIRRCLYYKAEGGGTGWRRALMRQLTDEWGWDRGRLARLDHAQWSIERTIEEWRRLVVELTFSYRVLVRFARDRQLANGMDARELQILQRKLNTAFERRPGKIDLQPTCLPLPVASRLHFKPQPAPDGGWALFDQVDVATHPPIRQARQLGELIAWVHFNQLTGRSSRSTVEGSISERALQRLFAELERWQSMPLPSTPHQAFASVQQPLSSMLVINLDSETSSTLHASGLARISSRSDALGYSGLRQNLVRTIDSFILTSWGELLTQRHVGNAALINTLVDHLNGHGMALESLPPLPAVSCMTEGRELLITERIEQCFAAVRQHFAPHDSRTARYLFEIEKELFMLEWEGARVVQRRFGSMGALFGHLATPAAQFRTLRIDPMSLPRHDLHVVAQLNQPNRIELLYRLQGQQIRIYIVDETGALFALAHPGSDPRQAVGPWLGFLERIDERRQRDGAPALALHCFELTGREPLATPRSFASLVSRLAYHAVEAVVEPADGGESRFMLRVGDAEFSSRHDGEALYGRVAEALLRQRRSGERYPAHLSDLDLGALAGQLPSTASYLHHKVRIEAAINRFFMRQERVG